MLQRKKRYIIVPLSTLMFDETSYSRRVDQHSFYCSPFLPFWCLALGLCVCELPSSPSPPANTFTACNIKSPFVVLSFNTIASCSKNRTSLSGGEQETFPWPPTPFVLCPGSTCWKPHDLKSYFYLSPTASLWSTVENSGVRWSTGNIRNILQVAVTETTIQSAASLYCRYELQHTQTSFN